MKKIYIQALFFFICVSLSAQNIRSGAATTPAEVSTIMTLDNLSIYPNPVYDIVKISVKSSDNTTLTINFYNNIGKLRFSQVYEIEEGGNVLSIDLKNNNVTSGVYFVELIADNERITRKLIVK